MKILFQEKSTRRRWLFGIRHRGCPRAIEKASKWVFPKGQLKCWWLLTVQNCTSRSVLAKLSVCSCQQPSVRHKGPSPWVHPHHKSLHTQQRLLQEVITCGRFNVALEAVPRLAIISESYQKQEVIAELLYGMIFSINNFNNLTGTKINLPFSSASITEEWRMCIFLEETLRTFAVWVRTAVDLLKYLPRNH